MQVNPFYRRLKRFRASEAPLMVNPPKTRKRVRALRRASDGSAFEKCDCCGVLVPIALIDMHACGTKNELKRFKGVCQKANVAKQGSGDYQVRSPFRFFMESFFKTCKSGKLVDIDRDGFRAWKNMSKEEKQPYVIQAEMVNAANYRALVEEVKNLTEVDEEADSAMVGKFDRDHRFEHYKEYEDYEYSDSLGFESLNVNEWEMVEYSWIVESSE